MGHGGVNLTSPITKTYLVCLWSCVQLYMPHYLLQNNLQQLDTWWEKQSVSLVKRGTSLARLTCLQKNRKVVLHKKKLKTWKNSIECLQKCWIQWGEGDINNLNNNFRQSLKDDVSWCLPWGRRKNTVTYFKGVTPFPHPIVRNVFAKKWWNCGITPTPPFTEEWLGQHSQLLRCFFNLIVF